jgi:defect-in-organelle-trafficking protein DotD
MPFIGGGDDPEPMMMAQPSETDLILKAIQQSAKQIQVSISRMSAAKQIKTPRSNVTKQPANPSLIKRVSVTWSGPMSDVAKSVAMQIGWKYRTVGEVPVVRPIVHINSQNETAFNVLRDIGLQAGSKAGLTIDTHKKIIIISYQGA